MSDRYDYNDNECGSCYWLRDKRKDSEMFNGPDNEKGHCLEQKNYYYPDESICSYYKDKKSYVPGQGCYITTIVCEILGFDDKCGILETLRNFRNNVMQKDPKYASILFEYDTVGPEIAGSLKEDNDLELIHNMFNFYIQPTVSLITDNKKEEAIEKYKEMTKSLEEYYNIPFNGIVPLDYDYTKGGHGIKRLGTI